MLVTYQVAWNYTHIYVIRACLHSWKKNIYSKFFNKGYLENKDVGINYSHVLCVLNLWVSYNKFYRIKLMYFVSKLIYLNKLMFV